MLDPRGRALRGDPPPARVEEPLRLDRGGRRLRDGRGAAWPRSPTRRGRSSPSTTGRRRAASSRRRSREPAAPRRGPGARRPGPVGTPRRTASGVDPNRVALLVAVLGRRAGIGLASHDVYVNLAGGLTVDEPGLDLPLALALASSLRDRPIATGTVAIGEVGLLGELRRSRAGAPAARGGPARVRPGDRAAGTRDAAWSSPAGMEVVAVGSLAEAVERALVAAPGRVAGASARPATSEGDGTQQPVRFCSRSPSFCTDSTCVSAWRTASTMAPMTGSARLPRR